jgi:hypothetical protein
MARRTETHKYCREIGVAPALRNSFAHNVFPPLEKSLTRFCADRVKTPAWRDNHQDGNVVPEDHQNEEAADGVGLTWQLFLPPQCVEVLNEEKTLLTIRSFSRKNDPGESLGCGDYENSSCFTTTCNNCSPIVRSRDST